MKTKWTKVCDENQMNKSMWWKPNEQKYVTKTKLTKVCDENKINKSM